MVNIPTSAKINFVSCILATYYILAQMNTIIAHPFVEHLMLSNPNDGIYIEETSANKYFIKAIYIFTLKWQENVLLVDA